MIHVAVECVYLGNTWRWLTTDVDVVQRSIGRKLELSWFQKAMFCWHVGNIFYLIHTTVKVGETGMSPKHDFHGASWRYVAIHSAADPDFSEVARDWLAGEWANQEGSSCAVR